MQQALQIQGIEARTPHHATLMMRKAYNKFVFDQNFFQEVSAIEEDHHRQMAALFAELKMPLPQELVSKLKDPLAGKDAPSRFSVSEIFPGVQGGEGVVLQKYKTMFVRP